MIEFRAVFPWLKMAGLWPNMVMTARNPFLVFVSTKLVLLRMDSPAYFPSHIKLLSINDAALRTCTNPGAQQVKISFTIIIFCFRILKDSSSGKKFLWLLNIIFRAVKKLNLEKIKSSKSVRILTFWYIV